MVIGQVVTYAELSALIGRDVRKAGYGNLTTARAKALQENQMVFGTVQNVGLQRLDDSGSLSVAREKLGRARTAARRSRKIAATIEPKNLTKEERVIYETTTVTAAVLDLVTKPAKQKILETRVAANNTRPPVADVLRLFAESE